MSRLFDLVAPECGKNMKVGQEVDLTPECHKERDTEGIRKILKEEGSGEDYPNDGDTIRISFKAYIGKEISGKIFQEDANFRYEVCRGKFVRGFELAILSMKLGERAEIYLKPEYGYGKAGDPKENIPKDTPVTYVVQLLDIQCPDLSPDSDRSILKKTIVRGKGWKVPNDGAKMTVCVKGWYTEGKGEDVVFVDKDDLCFPYGEGTFEKYNVPSCVENLIHHWKKKERARLFLKSQHAYGKTGSDKFKIPPDTDLTFIIEVKEFEKEKDLWEMNDKEKLDTCEKLKDKGTFYWKQKDMNLAHKFYARIVDILSNDFCMKDAEETRRQDLLNKGYLNLALVCLNQKKDRLAKDCCDKALAMEGCEKNVKGLFRRGQASFNLYELAEAQKDFKKVLDLEPNNAVARARLADTIRKAQETAGQDKELAQKMASGFGKGRDDRLMYDSGMNDIDESDNGMAHGMMTLEKEQAAFGEIIYERGGNNHGINN